MTGIRCLPSHQGSWKNRRIKCGPATPEKPCTSPGGPLLLYPNEKGNLSFAATTVAVWVETNQGATF